LRSLVDPTPVIRRVRTEGRRSRYRSLAARRPRPFAVLTEVAASPRWAHRGKAARHRLNPDTSCRPTQPRRPSLDLDLGDDQKLPEERLGVRLHDLLQRRPPVRTPPKSGLQ
jgi:hypothetical protein